MALKIFKLWIEPLAELYFIRIINNLVIEKARFLKDPPFLNPLAPPLTKRGKKYYFYYAFRQAQGVSYV